MPFLPISGFYAALLAMLMLILAYQVVKQRVRHKAGLGHQQHDDLLVAGRAHANATEYIPIMLILLAAAELNGANPTLLHTAGVAMLLSRLVHAWGFSAAKGKTHRGRYWGTLVTWLTILWLCSINLLLSWRYIF